MPSLVSPVQADDDDLGPHLPGHPCVGDDACRIDDRRAPLLARRREQSVVAERVRQMRHGDAGGVEHGRHDLRRFPRHTGLADAAGFEDLDRAGRHHRCAAVERVVAGGRTPVVARRPRSRRRPPRARRIGERSSTPDRGVRSAPRGDRRPGRPCRSVWRAATTSGRSRARRVLRPRRGALRRARADCE